VRGLAREPVLESAFVGQRSSTPHDVHLDSSAASSRQPPTSAAVRNIRTAVAAFLGKLFALLTALVIGVSFPQVSHASIDVADVKSRVEWAQLPSVVSWNSPPTHSQSVGAVLESMEVSMEPEFTAVYVCMSCLAVKEKERKKENVCARAAPIFSSLSHCLSLSLSLSL